MFIHSLAFLDDQREASRPLQDQHLLPFGRSAPSLLTLNLKNKNKSWWGGSKGSKMLMGLRNSVSFCSGQIHFENF